MVDNELFEGVSEEARIPESLEPMLEFAAFDKLAHSPDGTTCLKHRARSCRCTHDQRFVDEQSTVYVAL